MMEDYLTRKEVADILKVNPNTITTMQTKQLFPMPDKRCLGRNGRVLWKKETVENYLATNRKRQARQLKAKKDKKLIVERIKNGETKASLAAEYKVSVGLVRSFIKSPITKPSEGANNEFIPPKHWNLVNQVFNQLV